MALLKEKKGVILGIANERSIAAGIAQILHQEGAEMAFNHLPDKPGFQKMEKRVRKVVDPLNAKLVQPCDVQDDEQIQNFFSHIKETYGTIDFLVHSIAFAPLEDIICPTLDCSRNGFKTAMDISVYSFIAIAREAAKLMPNGGSMIAMTYFGGEKVVGGYNVMGVCKAALESTVQYLAYDLGPYNIRVNAISAGPIETLAASAVAGSISTGGKDSGSFADLLKLTSAVSPLGKNVAQQDIGKSAAYLLSELSTRVTGEIIHVDAGYNIMGSPGHALKRLGIT